MGYITNHKNRSPESYPDPRGGAGTVVPFARNSAVGPAGPGSTIVDLDPGTQIPWEIISSGAPAGVDVPITPITSGIIRIEVVVELKNGTNAPVNAQVVVQIDNIDQPFPFTEVVTVPLSAGQNFGSGLAVPILAEVQGLTVGVTYNVEILVIADEAGLALIAESSSIDIQEVAIPTG